MHLKDRILAIVLVLCLLTGVFIYSKYDTATISETDSGYSLFQKKETIYFWYADETMTDYINSAAVAFGEQYGVRVMPQLTAESEYIEAINQASLYGEQMPDLFLISNDSLEKAYLAGLATEINDMDQIVNNTHFPNAAISAVTYKEKKVAYPIFYETSTLLYNQTYLEEWASQQANKELEVIEVEEGFEQDENNTSEEIMYDESTLQERIEFYQQEAIPKTLDDILNIADTFDPPESVEGIFRWDVSDIFYNYFFVGNYMVVGGDPGDDKSNINIFNDETIQCLEIYKALNQFFYIEPNTVTYESVIQDFLEGKIVFTVATTDAVERLKRASEEGEFLYDYGFCEMPNPNTSLSGRSLSVTGAVAINGYSEHKELANKFASFLASEYAENMYERTGKIAADRNINNQNPYLQVFLQEYEKSIPLPKLMETSNYWIQLEILFSKIWNGAQVEAQLKDLSEQILSQVDES